MAKNNKKKWALLGAVAGLCAAPFTGGASLTWTAAMANTGLGFVGGTVFGEMTEGGSDDNDDGIQRTQQNYNAQMEQWKALSEERRQELERLRKKEEEKERQIKKNEEEIKALESKLNDPNLGDEERNKLKKRLIALQEDNRKLRGELTTIKTQIEGKEKDKPPVPAAPSIWKFPKLSAYDKLLAAAILALIIYFLFLREDKRK